MRLEGKLDPAFRPPSGYHTSDHWRIDMSFRVKVILDKIVCHETEDTFGNDEFYIIAALNKKSQGKVMTSYEGPWDINDGQTKTFDNGLTLFDEPTDDEKEFMLEITCWDQDASEKLNKADLKRASILIDDMKNVIGEARVARGNQPTPNNWIEKGIDGLFYLITLLVDQDKDDFLGKERESIVIPTDFPIVDDSKKIPRRFKCTNDGANYDVHYTIHLVDV